MSMLGSRPAAIRSLPGLLIPLLSLLLSICPASLAAPTQAQLALVPESLPGGVELPLALRRRLAENLAARGPDYRPRTKNLRTDGTPMYSNRLLLETSPYLQQHAHNPVNWYPWGDEAFETAKQQGRPLLVSIGYSTCHWCHVMEEETFDKAEHVRFLNEHFIAIKVDRETRPDIDSIYMSAVHAMGQRGGWPLNVWLTPAGRPFFGGTYFPPSDRNGRRGFPSILRAIHTTYARDASAIDVRAKELTARIERSLEGQPASATRVPDEAILAQAREEFARRFDPTWGGVGSETKFPSSLPIRFLLRRQLHAGDEEALKMAVLTLEKMAAGGIHDHVGGGFHRYSTELRWLVPHFEKMLYDNALLAMAYLEAAQLTGREDFARIARSTLDYVAREMSAPGGGFYSATDADSLNDSGEVEEGWFFTWTKAEIQDAVGPTLARTVESYYGVTADGNHDGRNILHTWREPNEVARELGVSLAELERETEEARARLYRERKKRTPPLRDEKILVAWNGLMISAFARAGFVLGESRYLERAKQAATYILDEMRVQERLRRVSLRGHAAGPAFLEDYAMLIAGLLDLYEAKPETIWLQAAIELQGVLDRHYADASGGGYFRTADDGETLLAREKPVQDGALPSGNSIEALNLLRLAEFTGNDAYTEDAVMLFSAFYDRISQRPTSHSEMLVALEFYIGQTKEIVLVLPADGSGAEALVDTLRNIYITNRIIAVVRQGPQLDEHARWVPLLSSKRALAGKATAFVCENRVCAYPTSDPGVFAEQLRVTKKREARPNADGGGSEPSSSSASSSTGKP